MNGIVSEILDWAKKNPALVISGLSLLVATLGFLLTHFARFRAGFRHTFLTVGGWLGFTRARYKAAFLKRHSELHNIYLDRIEHLDVRATYVPLHVLSGGSSIVNQPAIDVLLDIAQDRVVVLGDPGSGKTTLLKAFGVSLVSYDYGRKQLVEKSPEPAAARPLSLLPIYVELRDFASKLDQYPRLSDYIVDYVLDKDLHSQDRQAFLRKLLARKECVVLLDALDEVGTESYEALRQAVHVFMADTSETLPTANARVVMTSRYQNFLGVRNDWVPSAFPQYNVLAPFSDEDIQRFLKKRAADLPAGKSPAALWEEIRHSSTLDLHRTPLILTVSLGLYRSIPRYTIPESIGRFYEEISKALLQRHDFQTRPYLSKRNVFPSEFKLQFLREFAYKAAIRPGRFDEFSYEELADAFDALRQRNAKITAADRDKFIREIIDNAGLLRQVSDSGTHVFAHRSFHEYFVALHLSKSAEQGAKDLIERSEDPLWRQITIFFAAMDHDKHDLLLKGLAERNPELAGYCLAVTTNVSPNVALQVADRLNARVSRSNAVSVLGALSAICRNSGEPVRKYALHVIRRVLTDVLILADATALRGLTRDDLVRLAHDLAATGARNIVEACITLSQLVEDDPRVVAPLWICLGFLTDEPEAPEAQALVMRLLELAQMPEGFDALQECPPLAPAFATAELRAFVYPLSRGLAQDSNLVTLLAWADQSYNLPDKRNGFLKAFVGRRSSLLEWRRLERDLAKTPITIRPFWLGALLFWGGGMVCLVNLLRTYFTQGYLVFEERYFVFFKRDILVWIIVVMLCFGLGFVVAFLIEIFQNPLLTLPERDWAEAPPPANPSLSFSTALFNLFSIVGVQSVFILTGTGLITTAPGILRVMIGLLLALICFWLPATRLFEWQRRLDLRRRSRLAFLILADPSSLRWVQRNS